MGFAFGANFLILFKLRIFVFYIFQGQCFDKGTFLKASFLFHLIDGISGHFDALFLEQLDNLKYLYG